MFFDCTALLTGLTASIISRWGKNERFSYGYVQSFCYLKEYMLILIFFMITSRQGLLLDEVAYTFMNKLENINSALLPN